jgi:hypothetical protein
MTRFARAPHAGRLNPVFLPSVGARAYLATARDFLSPCTKVSAMLNITGH